MFSVTLHILDLMDGEAMTKLTRTLLKIRESVRRRPINRYQLPRKMASPYRMSITDPGSIINGQGGKDSDVMARVGIVVCGSGANG